MISYTGSSLCIGDLKSAPLVTHFLQQGHTYSNKATPPNSATPYEIMGANYIQTIKPVLQSEFQDSQSHAEKPCLVWNGLSVCCEYVLISLINKAVLTYGMAI